MINTAIQDKTRAELEGIFLLLMSNVREYREREQQALSDPAKGTSELMRIIGGVAALKSVEGLIERLAELYKVEL